MWYIVYAMDTHVRENTTTIRIKRTTKAELEKFGVWGETHDDIILKLIEKQKELYSPKVT